MRMPFSGSRTVITSQNERWVRTPTPSGFGHTISGATFLSAGAAGAGFRTGFFVCANAGAAATAHAHARTARRMAQCTSSRSLLALRPQVGGEELVHAVPGVAQHVLAREVVELARVRHERHEAALSFLEQLINETHRVQVRHVHV